MEEVTIQLLFKRAARDLTKYFALFTTDEIFCCGISIIASIFVGLLLALFLSTCYNILWLVCILILLPRFYKLLKRLCGYMDKIDDSILS
jgi:hypothetical protein